jgi:hypothetical protein
MKRRNTQAEITDISWNHLPATVVFQAHADGWEAVRRTNYGHVEMQSNRPSNTTYLWFVWRGRMHQRRAAADLAWARCFE